MIILFFGIVIALAFFFYFQKKTSDRNMEHFQRSRDRYDRLLEQLRNTKDQATGEKAKEADK
jgi:hypothetical protein